MPDDAHWPLYPYGYVDTKTLWSLHSQMYWNCMSVMANEAYMMLFKVFWAVIDFGWCLIDQMMLFNAWQRFHKVSGQFWGKIFQIRKFCYLYVYCERLAELLCCKLFLRRESCFIIRVRLKQNGCHFELKLLHFNHNFTENYSQGSN